MKIGKKIRTLRKERGMTLLELSEKSGVALATLSRVENERMTGTLESHMAVCGALGIDLTELYKHLSSPRARAEVQTSSERTEVFVHDRKSVSEMLASKVLEKKMMPIMIRLEPGGRTHREENKKGVEKFIYVLVGKAEAVVGETRYSLSKGDTLYFDSSAPHHFKNSGKLTARIICVISPPVL